MRYPECENLVLSIKGGLRPDLQVDGSREGVRRSVDNFLRLLDGKKTLDIFECARVDPKMPIETTVAGVGGVCARGEDWGDFAV